MQGRLPDKVGWTFAVLVGALLPAIVLLLLVNYARSPFSFNSDNLYCNAFCDDLLHGRDMTGWHLPGAPYIFPDMLFLLPCQAFTSNLFLTYFAYCLLFYFLMTAVLTWIARMIGFPRRQAFLMAGLGVMFLTAVHIDPAYLDRAVLLAHAGSHMGGILVGLFLTGLVLRSLWRSSGWLSTSVIVVCCALGGFSDKLLVVQFIVPIVLTLMILAIRRLISFEQSTRTAALLIVSTALLFSVKALFARWGFHLLPLETRFHQLPEFSLVVFAQRLSHCVADQTLLQVLLGLYLPIAAAVSWMGLRNPSASHASAGIAPEPGAEAVDRRAILFVSLVLNLSLVCSVGAVVGMGLHDHPFLYRYLLPCFLLPFLFLGLFVRLFPWNVARWAGRLLPGGILLFAVYRTALLASGIDWRRLEPPYPALAQTIDRLVRQRGPMRGLGNFWSARYLSYLSREHVPIRPLDAQGGLPWFHATNPNAFLSDEPGDESLPVYRLLIWSNTQDPTPFPRDQIRQVYGEPAEEIAVGPDVIWIYDRVAPRPFQLFLRAQLARRLRKQHSFLTPAHPAVLAKPKDNLTPFDARGNVRLAAGQSLEVHFAKPITGRVLDIGANYCDRYMLDFFHGQECVGHLNVPRVLWTGTAYGKAGIQARLLPLPNSWRDRSWDRVVVTPQGSPEGFFSLAHFLVYPEAVFEPDEPSGYRSFHERLEGEKLSSLPDVPVQTVTDARASGGAARRSAPGSAGWVAFGPYIYLPPGRYRVDFALKIDERSSSGTLATIEVFNGGPSPLAARELSASDFPVENAYAVHTLTFDNAEDLDTVEFRLHSTGKCAVSLDYVEITRSPSPIAP